MKSQPQNPEFRNNPENLYPCDNTHKWSREACLCDRAIMM